MYRIATLIGEVLGHCETRHEANVLAEYQSRQRQDIIVIKKKDNRGHYQEVEMRIAQTA